MRLHLYLSAILGIGLSLVFFARVIESVRLSTQEFIEVGLLYDKICYMGSYLIVCPYTAPPYETALIILALSFAIAIWIIPGKRSATK